MDENRYTPELRFEEFTEPWKQQELGNIAKIVAGGDVDKRRLRPTGKYPVLANALTNDGIVGYYDDSYRIEAPAVTVTGRGEVGHAKARFAPFTPVVRLLAVITKSDVSFIAEAINLTNIALESTGVPQLTVPQLASVQLRIPDTVEEQQAIGTFFHKLDSLITLQQRKYERLQHLKQALLRKMFPKPGEQVPELRFEGFTEPWKERKLGELVDVCNGRDYKHLDKGVIPVYGTGGYMTSVSEALSYSKDAIGIGRKGTIDRPYILRAPFWTVDTLFYAIPKHEVDLDFAFCLFSNINWRSKDESSGVPSLSKQAIDTTRAKVPGTDEQRIIGTFFRNLDSLIALYQSECERLQHLKQAMLQRMFV